MEYLETVREKREREATDGKNQEQSQAVITAIENVAKTLTGVKSVNLALNNTGITEALQKLNTVLASLQPESNDEMLNALHDINDTLANINMRPQVNVNAPDVNVPEINIEPLVEALKQGEDAEAFDLNNFRAHDIDDDSDAHQYVGLVSPSGQWCIIENDINGNSLRYFFGKRNYKSGWAKHTSHKYKLLSEAVNALRS